MAGWVVRAGEGVFALALDGEDADVGDVESVEDYVAFVFEGGSSECGRCAG